MLGATPWLVDGRPAPAAQQAVNMLAAAAAEGLQPEDYQAAWLAQAVAGAAQGPALGADAALQLEDALTTAVQSYLSDLRSGRIDPRQIHQNYTPTALPVSAPATAVQEAIAPPPALADAVRAATPKVPLYASLRGELARYLEDWQRDPQRLATVLATEGLQPIEGKLENLDRLYDAGFRIAGLTHFFDKDRKSVV